MEKIILLLSIVFLYFHCAPNIPSLEERLEGRLEERWIDIDDLLRLEEGMAHLNVLDIVGEPILINLIEDSTLNKNLEYTYNLKVKLYELENKNGFLYNEKPSKRRDDGAPYGNIHRIKITFVDDKLYEIIGLNNTNITTPINIVESENNINKPTSSLTGNLRFFIAVFGALILVFSNIF